MNFNRYFDGSLMQPIVEVTHSAAPIIRRYQVIAIPGVELCECLNCGGAHPTQDCGEIRAALIDSRDDAHDQVAELRQQLDAKEESLRKAETWLTEESATNQRLRSQLATAHEALGAAKAVLNRIDLYGNRESVAVGVVLLAIDKALA